ncbi:hypothetical protein DP73_03175 [Desulfosporosinus sp. HMP52]|uniref:DNA adenine methylase n=1 Tax=Desulfosporosinus sp. HMP52 TaxID=1487923 RepID=UPI00051F969D|nr:DNA adenine methylase [Desulfosporosinus sp. HMP52]KGK91437.1 hypothetical protein DP73_03175 [Desulfosporosinus sp. HMP52]
MKVDQPKAYRRLCHNEIFNCEPFGGTGWVLFEKPPSEVEVYNDINSELVNFFRVVKEKPEQFIQVFDYLLISREIFQKYKKLSLAGTCKTTSG